MYIITAIPLGLVEVMWLKFNSCFRNLKKLWKALHKAFYAKHIVMQSDTKRLSAYQSITVYTLQYRFA
jgi:hypothetical protein